MNERNIRLTVAYDGTKLHGYQKQHNAPTVQAHLEDALSKVCNEKITVYGSSRTDAGVHARCQIVTFFTKGQIPAENLKRALIAFLPSSIVVVKAEEIPLNWKIGKGIFGKRYAYRIRNAEIEDPLTRHLHWLVKKPLDIMAMQIAAEKLEGTHDFTSFAGVNTTPQNPQKTIYAIAVEKMDNDIIINVLGDGFLYHMVRNIAGFLVDVGLKRLKADLTPQLLEAKSRKVLGKTAPAQGLCLERVYLSEKEKKSDVDSFVLKKKHRKHI